MVSYKALNTSPGNSSNQNSKSVYRIFNDFFIFRHAATISEPAYDDNYISMQLQAHHNELSNSS